MDYIITKKRIKNFIIRIYPDKTIKISVPLNATREDIDRFIKNKKDWIDKALAKFNQIKEIEPDNKNTVKIFGKNRIKKFIKSEINMVNLRENTVFIYHSFDLNDKKKMNVLLEKWKLDELNKILKEYLDKYLKILNTSIKAYKIKTMKSAWGIYHIKENYITFNSLLIEKDYKCIEYVVLHELCHIFYAHHQREFWNLVQEYMPDYKEHRKKLKQFE